MHILNQNHKYCCTEEVIFDKTRRVELRADVIASPEMTLQWLCLSDKLVPLLHKALSYVYGHLYYNKSFHKDFTLKQCWWWNTLFIWNLSTHWMFNFMYLYSFELICNS